MRNWKKMFQIEEKKGKNSQPVDRHRRMITAKAFFLLIVSRTTRRAEQ